MEQQVYSDTSPFGPAGAASPGHSLPRTSSLHLPRVPPGVQKQESQDRLFIPLSSAPNSLGELAWQVPTPSPVFPSEASAVSRAAACSGHPVSGCQP